MPLKPFFRDANTILYHADARDICHQLGSVDMIFTDPPYGHNNNNGDLIQRWETALARGRPGKPRAIKNDGPLEANALVQWLFFQAANMLRSGGCCCCCCGGGGPDPQFARWSLWMDGPLRFKQAVVWDKGPMGVGWHYRRSYEMVLIGEKRGGRSKWYDSSKRIENVIRHIRKIIPRNSDHPCPKPIELAEHFIRLHSKKGDTIFDPFAGAGSTLIAALQSGRKSIGIEVNEEYCRMAVAKLKEASAKRERA